MNYVLWLGQLLNITKPSRNYRVLSIVLLASAEKKFLGLRENYARQAFLYIEVKNQQYDSGTDCTVANRHRLAVVQA